MQNMYEQFYKFIAKIIIDFLKQKKVRPGEKLELKLNTKEEIQALTDTFKNHAESEAFIYETPQSEYKTICLNIEGIKMIVASDLENVTPSFLANLRNLVGTNHPLFKDTGVLFIHNSSLDTLISGADKLQKEGMPLHYKHIDKHIENMLKKDAIDRETKAIVQFVLGRQSRFTLNSANYLAEYREIIQVLTKGKVDSKQYEIFGLFYDSTLKSLSEREARKRLEENAKYYEMAHNYHELHVMDQALEKDFDKRGTNFITSEQWKTVDYKLLHHSLEKQRSTVPIEYIEDYAKETREGLMVWERPSSDTAAGKRTRHIIVFNPEGLKETTLALKFSHNPKKVQCEIVKGSCAQVETQGKKLHIYLETQGKTPTYSRIKYKDKKNFEFRILVLPFEHTFFQDIKTCFSLPTKLKDKAILIQKDEASFVLGKQQTQTKSVLLTEFVQHIGIDDTGISYSIKSELENPENEPLQIEAVIEEIPLRLILSGEPVKPKPISSIKLDKLRRESGQNIEYYLNPETKGIKLFLGTEQYFVQDELLKQLKLEIQLIKSNGCSYSLEKGLVDVEIALDDQLKQKYTQLIQYYRERNLLPSLATMTSTLEGLIVAFLDCFEEVIKNIGSGQNLTLEQKNLMLIGAVRDQEKQMILWSPLHPLNLAYTLQKHSVLKHEVVAEDVLKQLMPLQLVPFIRDESSTLYQVCEQGSGTWLYFEKKSEASTTRLTDSIKIIEKTLMTFRNHFKYLFQIKNYPLTINCIQPISGIELVVGILKYLYARNKVEEKETISPIVLRFYTKQLGRSIFHEVGHEDEVLIELMHLYLPMIKEKDYEQYIKLFRDKVTIYKDQTEIYKEAHISFIATGTDIEVTYRNMTEQDTSLSNEGLCGGQVCYTQGDNFIQTIGLKGAVDNRLVHVVKGLNALAYIGGSNDPYDPNVALALALPECILDEYEGVELQSDWTVYLEPKAEYHYFNKKSDCMIHYVDKTSASGMIEAITISKKTALYSDAICQHLKNLNIDITKDQLLPYIQLGNTLNGEWLVELLSFKKTSNLESVHTIGLLKWVKQLLDPTYQYWIPVSLHEFLRTCDGIGVKASKGLLSSKNYERLINDILWVGYRIDGTQVDVAFYPMRVGESEEGENLFNQLKEVIEGEHFEDRYFRQLLVQKALINAKLLEDKHFFSIPFNLSEEVRAKLINDQYMQTMEYKEYQKMQAVVAITPEYTTEIVHKDQYMFIQTNQEALWLDVLGIQSIQVNTKSEELEDPVGEDTDTDNKEQRSEEVEGLEDVVPKEALYSLVYYIEEATEESVQYIDTYIKQGVKLYLLFKQSKTQVSDTVGEKINRYSKLMKDQLLIMLFDQTLEGHYEEPYIADGEIEDKLFYKALKQTAFNHEQYEIEHMQPAEHIMVKAGAGTGKTKVMIDRIMYLKHIQAALRLEDIVMITFTNESTMEMRTRLASRLTAYYEVTKDKKYLDWMDELSSMEISTIHAFAKTMIGKLGESLGIIDLEVAGFKYRKIRLIEKAINTYSLCYEEAYKTFKTIKHYELVKMLLALSDYLDNRGVSLHSENYKVDFGSASSNTQHFFEFVLNQVEEGLEALKKETGACEINDLIKKLRELTGVGDVKSKCDFKYLMVDEFQDTDEVQVEFIAWLTNQVENKLFVVGDIKQSIYRFRGADYTAFRQIQDKLDYELTQRQLVKNYRSDEKLMQGINDFFAKISDWITYFEFEQEDVLEATQVVEEAKGIETIKLYHEEDKFFETKKLYQSHKDEGTVCVLTRTNKQVRELVEALEVIKVPTLAKVKGSFYKSEAVRDFYQLIRALLHTERLGEWVELEQTPYGKATLTPEKIMTRYVSNENYLLKLLKETPWYNQFLEASRQCREQSVLHVIEYLIKTYQPAVEYARRYYKNMMSEDVELSNLKEIAKYKGKNYEANLNKLLYVLHKTFTDESATLYHIEDFLHQKIATDRLEEEIVLEEEVPLKALRVMTVHQSKGLEFETVIIPYTTQTFENEKQHTCMLRKDGEVYKLGYHLRTQDRSFDNNYYGELLEQEGMEKAAEETRLFYVACTRAKHTLYLFVNASATQMSSIKNWQGLIVGR